MNILYLCGSYGLDLDKMLGPKIHVQSILKGLQKQGHKPILLAVQQKSQLEDKEYEKIKHYIIKHKAARFYVHKIIPYTGFLNSFRVFIKILVLNKIYHFDVIHERYTGLSWGGVLAAKILRIPYILQMVGPGIEEKMIQNNPLKPSKFWLLLINQKFLFSNCDHLILISKQIASFILKNRGWKLPYSSVLLNGASIPEPLSFEKKLYIRKQYKSENHPLFVFSGSLYNWYGSIDLLKAFNLALKCRPDIKLIIIGSGDAENEMNKYIRTNNLNKSIIMLGLLSHDIQIKIVQSADFCLVFYPKALTYQGTSIKTMEYMASGRPVISTPHMSEVIEDGATGFMSKTSDINDYANRILEVLKYPEDVELIAKKGQDLILTHYTWEKYINRLIRIYRYLV